MAGEFDFRQVAPESPYAIWMPRPVLLEALQRKAASLPAFECWMGAWSSGSRSPALRGLVRTALPLALRTGLLPRL